MAVLGLAVTIVVQIASLAYWLGKKFATIEERFREIDKRFGEVDRRFGGIDEKFKEIEQKVRGDLTRGSKSWSRT